MSLHGLCLLSVLASPWSAPAPAESLAPVASRAPLQDSAPDPVQAEYERLAEARDRAGLAELWRAHPGRILPTFDGDLEASLSLWEQDPGAPDQARIEALEARALFAAEVASEVRGNPLFADYASAFAGWNDLQKVSFRAGQAAFGRAVGALRSVEAKGEERLATLTLALAAAVDCRERALPLGDWWGTAMGYEAEARALLGLERTEEAAAAAAQARQLFHQLALQRNQLACTELLATACESLERYERAHAAVQQALAQVGSEPAARAPWLERRARLEERLGRAEAAAATRAELGGRSAGER
jgi:hypothetical protein